MPNIPPTRTLSTGFIGVAPDARESGLDFGAFSSSSPSFSSPFSSQVATGCSSTNTPREYSPATVPVYRSSHAPLPSSSVSQEMSPGPVHAP